MAIRRKKKINPKYRKKKLYKIRILVLAFVIWFVFTNSSNYTGIPVIGNISNQGIIAEYGNDIYYIKYKDGVYRSKLTSDKKIIDGQVYSMQIEGDYLYYMRYNDGSADIERVNRYGGKASESIVSFRTNISKFYFYDNYVYYIKNLGNDGIYRTNVDTLKEEQLIQSTCKDFQLDSGKIYYVIDSYLAVMNVDASEKDVLADAYISKIIVYKDWIYFTNSMNGDLMRINKLGNARNTLIRSFFVKDFNIFDDKIYYCNKQIGKICTVTITGNDLKEIKTTKNLDSRINITSNGDVYYLEYYPTENTYEYVRIDKNGKEKTISTNWRVI